MLQSTSNITYHQAGTTWSIEHVNEVLAAFQTVIDVMVAKFSQISPTTLTNKRVTFIPKISRLYIDLSF